MDERYTNKQNAYENYFLNVRKELLEMIPHQLKEGNLLEIGAGSCNTLVFAKENNYAKKVYDIELCQLENSNQNNPILDGFIIANIEEIKLPYSEKYFQVILCGDVLEHLADPYRLLNSLQKYLSDDGVIIVSLPNIRELKTLKKIVFDGDFKYTEAGILDKTHLRFFTKKNMIELLEDNGFQVDFVISSDRCNFKRYIKQLRLLKLFICVFKYIFEEFFTLQYYLLASKKK
jgi:2-polyprenyl-3-methyl-5-hydroxy-6-metoxy-1,4-benzoquinol methylase